MEQRTLLSPGTNGRIALTRDGIAQRLANRPNPANKSDNAVSNRLGGPDSKLTRPIQATLIPAAVLVPLIDRDNGLTVLLTERTAHLANHAGQVSFPGGHIEPDDASPTAAALREAQEETGLDPARVQILGELDQYVTATGFLVTPVVGIVEPPIALKPDPFEVAEAFEMPLLFALDRNNHHRGSRTTPAGEVRHYYVLPYAGHHIWGATAAILVNLCQVLGG